jgi:hypothetical protein
MQSKQSIKSFPFLTKEEELQGNENNHIFNMITLCDVIDFIRNKKIDDIPRRIRGKVMYQYEEIINTSISSRLNYYYTGFDENSCTSTTAAIFFFLKHEELTISSIGDIYNKSSFKQLPTILEMGNMLYTFYTPYHKFSVLQVGTEACIIQSNQDTFHCKDEDHQYTFIEYLKFPYWFPNNEYMNSSNDLTDVRNHRRFVKFNNLNELEECFNELRQSRDVNICESIYEKYFGIRFKHSKIEDEHWFTAVQFSFDGN